MIGARRQQLLRRAAFVHQYIYRLLFGDMFAQASRYPLRVPMGIMKASGSPGVQGDKFIKQGVALLVGLGLCISSFSLKKLSAVPMKPKSLI